MAQQPSFNFYPDAPRARRSDPLSSHRAADEVAPHLSGQRRAVWEALKKHPGRSSKELSEVSNLDRYMIARRLPELEQFGLVSRVGSGSRDVRWFVVKVN